MALSAFPLVLVSVIMEEVSMGAMVLVVSTVTLVESVVDVVSEALLQATMKAATARTLSNFFIVIVFRIFKTCAKIKIFFTPTSNLFRECLIFS